MFPNLRRQDLRCSMSGLNNRQTVVNRTSTVVFLLVAVLLVGSTHSFSPVSTSSLPLRYSKRAISFPPSKNVPPINSPPSEQHRSSSTSLQAVGLGAIAGAISGGLFAGGLHAIAGPDHLAALLPRCCGQRWYRAGRVGALWGMGHGVSATLLGITAYGLKTQLNARSRAVLAGAGHITEIAVGLSLILIGAMGIKEAREWEDEIIVTPTDNTTITAKSLSAAAADTGIKTAQKRAVIFNGLLHGFSWDGAPSLAPALAVATWTGNLAFLSAYAVGTMTAMAITTTLIGEGTRKAGQFFQRPDIPQKLSLISSFIAIAIGVVWCGLAVM